ncbi:MAG: dihydroneopterin aldolase [Armatimonadetes bacterium]|uniref:7,8-dihydroneopterin aldolase n=1 Tax=Candidatus Nitrosymbiomonas proteolyticus TaxID=2608984 RepID=A0A809SB95_9BACT|nr:dihydroneopterin aldolase [Armatimonadota bacterium]MCK6631945.1 dihydroneopterin aldolase [Fimbriimonadaceae bacterium]BBO24821.1 dihydroneopterin aldolase [Candidatus Nitrosymbiomonas proteolyticus]NOG39219.1 dihydroneopterin aldolase [Armatimonadota bacterium]NUM38551.1 dihydroneopterin aldolase [Armatimonadota bacterium]
MAIVFVKGLRAFGRHGVTEQERVAGCDLVVDLELLTPDESASTDEIEHTADYGVAARIAQEVIEGTSAATVEWLAGEIGRRVLSQMPQVQQATVSVAKPTPPLPYDLDCVGATVRTAR